MTQTEAKNLKPFDPVYDEMEKTRARFIRMVGGSAVELADNDGYTLPDWRHIDQVKVMR
jgi:hypothetical protein